ncbi:MAG: lysylphosphatidylglycerol synthase transmembrane domain-containing protein [Dehalococcoidia bacterium]
MTKTFLGIFSGVLLLVFFIWTSDISEMLKHLSESNFYILIPGLVCYFLSLWLRTIRWKYLLGTKHDLKNKTLFPIVVIGYMANNILPLRAGEFIRSYLLSQKSSIKLTTGIGTIFVERIMDALALIFLVITMSFFIPISNIINHFETLTKINSLILILIFSVPFVMIFILLLVASFLPKLTLNFVEFSSKFLPDRISKIYLELFQQFFDGFKYLNNRKVLTITLILSVPIWVLEGLLFYFVCVSIGIDHNFESNIYLIESSIMITGIVNLGAAIPITPGGIGLFEIIARETMILIPYSNTSRSEAAAFAGMTHALLIIPIVILGQIYLWKNGMSIKNIKTSEQGSKN